VRALVAVLERQMKRIVLNRKNSLFVGNSRGQPRPFLGQLDQHLPPTRY